MFNSFLLCLVSSKKILLSSTSWDLSWDFYIWNESLGNFPFPTEVMWCLIPCPLSVYHFRLLMKTMGWKRTWLGVIKKKKGNQNHIIFFCQRSYHFLRNWRVFMCWIPIWNPETWAFVWMLTRFIKKDNDNPKGLWLFEMLVWHLW